MGRATNPTGKYEWKTLHEELDKVTQTATGVICGAVSYKAIELGYKTGANTCFMYGSEMYNTTDKVLMTIGIGHPQYEDHSTRSADNHGISHQGPQRQKLTAPFTHIKDNKLFKTDY
jgi:hypothetical protein